MSAPQAGDKIPLLEIDISREDLVRYAGAADDYVRLHWDHPYMVSNGFPDVAVHGWLTFAHMCRAVTDWLAPKGWTIAGYSVRYVRPTYPGIIRCGGELVSVDDSQMSLAVWARNGEGLETTTATVKVLRASGAAAD